MIIDKFLSNFKWIMALCGLLTCSMFLGLFSPEASLQMNFGEIPGSSPYENIIVRNWSALLGLTGIMLLYGAFKPSVRSYSLIIAGISKVIFITLVLTIGSQYLRHQVGTAVMVDCLMVFLFTFYLILSAFIKKDTV